MRSSRSQPHGNEWLKLENADLIKDGDQLRNINCYDYLQRVAKAIHDELITYNFDQSNKKEIKFLQDFNEIFYINSNTIRQYDDSYPYGDYYTVFIRYLNEHIDVINSKEFHKLFNLLINSIYINNNESLERTEKLIDDVINNKELPHTSHQFENTIRKRFISNETNKVKRAIAYLRYGFNLPEINTMTSPHEEGSFTGRLFSMLSPNYNSQATTSMPMERHYQYKTESGLPKEIRIGTQGQYSWYRPRISKLFENWIIANRDLSDAKKITHVYFNNLGLDRSPYSFSGRFEKKLSDKLHSLHDSHENIAVITLPADMGLMDKVLHKNHKEEVTGREAFEKMLAISIGDKVDEDIKDFFISDKIKKLLYGFDDKNILNKKNEKEIMHQLLLKSFEAMGIPKENMYLNLTHAQIQAVYFHFIKYELTNFILDKLQPTTFNIACKDAIDRGGVSSAYYNLLKSIELSSENDAKKITLDKNEFYRALHAAPALVKGRGMNYHTIVLWNAVNGLIEGKQKTIPPWLLEWRNENAPSHTKIYYVNQLEKYILAKKSAIPNKINLFYNPDYTNEVKISAATMLLSAIKENKNIYSASLNHQLYIKALHQGNLGKIFDAIQRDHLSPKIIDDVTDPSEYIPNENNKFQK